MIEESIVSIIASVGFPIVAFLLMYYQTNTTIRSNTEALHELKEELKYRR